MCQKGINVVAMPAEGRGSIAAKAADLLQYPL